MKLDLKSTEPVAIILADTSLSSDLNTIFGQQDLSSLIIAGNTILEHLLMELQDLKIQDCIVLAGRNSAEVKALIGDTRRWGINITVINYSLKKDQVLRDYKSLSAPNGLLIIEMDCLRSRCIERFVKQARLSQYCLLEAWCAGQMLGITLLKANNSDFIINAMPLDLDGTVVNRLDSIRSFHQANFDVVLNLFPGLEPSVQLNNTIGQRQHWASQVDAQPESYKRDVMIDRRCRVGKGVHLDSVILNHNVYVQKNAHLENIIVMPNAVISANRPIKNAIVHGDRVHQI
jgi:hypothetical protein